MQAHVQAIFKVKLTEEQKEQIKYWIKNKEKFNIENIELGPEEVLVEVKAEHCSACSSGLACYAINDEK